MSSKCRIPLRRLRAALALAVVFLLAVGATPSTQAQIFTILYTFKGGTDGVWPSGGVSLGRTGSLYGTTTLGGTWDYGTVYQLTSNGRGGWTETVLYNFDGHRGQFPWRRVVQDAEGNLYGATRFGGDAGQCLTGYGCGTIFKLDKSGNETVLYAFTGGPDGGEPLVALLRDPKGNLYGTTNSGGSSQYGTVFKLDSAGKETALYSFTGGADGAFPYAAVVRDASGNLYGTTSFGGSSSCSSVGCGVVFKLHSSGNLTVLHTFTGPDGARPFAGLVRDIDGTLYGTTVAGGNLNDCNGNGCGTVFKVDKTGKETVLYSFTGGADGSAPFAALVRDAKGNLYGTTQYGGILGGLCAGGGCGTVFKVNKAGKETVLHKFTGRADGEWPYAGLVRDAKGKLYGTTSYGGVSYGGTVFMVVP